MKSLHHPVHWRNEESVNVDDINGDWTAKDIKLNEILCSTNTDDECGIID